MVSSFLKLQLDWINLCILFSISSNTNLSYINCQKQSTINILYFMTGTAVLTPIVWEKLIKIEVYCGVQCLLKCSLDYFWI